MESMHYATIRINDELGADEDIKGQQGADHCLPPTSTATERKIDHSDTGISPTSGFENNSGTLPATITELAIISVL
jgi:hypothetical protein